MSEQQYSPPDPRLQLIATAALKYQRAAQVAADAVYVMYNRLAQRSMTADAAAQLTAAAVPAITEAVLNDEDILDPQPEE